jgi:hypothetical protein
MAKPKRRRRIDISTRVDPNRRYTVPDTSELLAQSVAKTYLDIQRKHLQIIKDGARTYIPGSEIIRRSTLPQ